MKSELQSGFKTDVAILGVGIGGYEAFRTLHKLCKKYRLAKDILLIDQNNYSSFALLNHEVASGAVEPTHASLPLRELAYNTKRRFLKAKVLNIDPKKKNISTGRGIVNYNHCIVALGSITNYFGTPGAEEFSYQVRSLAGAMVLRHNLIMAVEGEKTDLTITVVGGGFTGIEVAGQMQYFINHDLKKLYPEKRLFVRLVHSSETLAPQLTTAAQQKIVRRLKSMGVEILFNSRVERVTDHSVVIRREELPSDFTVWCAGFANIANQILAAEFCGVDQRIPTNAFLQLPAEPSLYAIGDNAFIANPSEGKPVPQLGEAAYHAGRYVAKHLSATWRNQTLPPFKFVSKGILMPIGDRYGVGVIKGATFDGLIIWWLRRTVYLTFMPGIIRKLRIVIDWTLRLFGFRYIIVIERK